MSVMASCVNQTDEIEYNFQTTKSNLKLLVYKGLTECSFMKNFQWYPLCYVGVTWLILTDKFCVTGLCESWGAG